METSRIAELLRPFLSPAGTGAGRGIGGDLSQEQFNNISIYINILLKWNARMNLTAVRQPEEIVTRHFGESLFAAKVLFPEGAVKAEKVLDLGSGAGFPGLPIKIWRPALQVTLIEANHKKATFLREVCRNLKFTDVEVLAERAEKIQNLTGDMVTLRAVERFESVLPLAAKLTKTGGRLALLIGGSQVTVARDLRTLISWEDPVSIPQSKDRVLMVGITQP